MSKVDNLALHMLVRDTFLFMDAMAGEGIGYDGNGIALDADDICLRASELLSADWEGGAHVFAGAIADYFTDQAKRIQQLEEMLKGIADFLDFAPAESGVCCCGSPMDGHTAYDGHSPVDQFSYSAEGWAHEAKSLLKAKP